tara:strand:+ start:291 stop:542 length:252 start_codon:yes stop_codon:yes gene_type:complete
MYISFEIYYIYINNNLFIKDQIPLKNKKSNSRKLVSDNNSKIETFISNENKNVLKIQSENNNFIFEAHDPENVNHIYQTLNNK